MSLIARTILQLDLLSVLSVFAQPCGLLTEVEIAELVPYVEDVRILIVETLVPLVVVLHEVVA